MASNETIAEIVREMFEYPKSWGEYNHLDWKALAKRIQEAYDHELDVQYWRISRLVDKLAAKDDERLTIVANYEHIIAAKDAEIAKLSTLTTQTDNSEVIAELQRRLKVAEKFAAEMKESTNSLVRACGHQMILRLQGEGGNDEK